MLGFLDVALSISSNTLVRHIIGIAVFHTILNIMHRKSLIDYNRSTNITYFGQLKQNKSKAYFKIFFARVLLEAYNYLRIYKTLYAIRIFLDMKVPYFYGIYFTPIIIVVLAYFFNASCFPEIAFMLYPFMSIITQSLIFYRWPKEFKFLIDWSISTNSIISVVVFCIFVGVFMVTCLEIIFSFKRTSSKILEIVCFVEIAIFITFLYYYPVPDVLYSIFFIFLDSLLLIPWESEFDFDSDIIFCLITFFIKNFVMFLIALSSLNTLV